MNLFSKLSTWYFSRKALPYWSIILLDCLVILFSGLLVYALNNGIFATMGIFWHLSLTWGVCLVPYLVGFRLFRTYSGIIRYSSFVDLQRVGFAVLFGVVCVVTFQEFTDFSPYLVYIRKRDLVLSSLLAMSLMWAMRVFVKYFYVTTFRQSKAERAFIFGVKQGGISLAKSIQNQDPAQYVLAGFVSEACRLVLEAGTMGNGGEIFVFDMGKPVRIIDLAKRMIQLSGAKNVEVRFTGLRAGEKLYEEVLNDEEITLPTFHPKIKIAKVREYDYDTVCQDIDELVGLGRSRDDMAIVGKMKAIVPEFKSRHSKYEALDK